MLYFLGVFLFKIIKHISGVFDIACEEKGCPLLLPSHVLLMHHFLGLYLIVLCESSFYDIDLI